MRITVGFRDLSWPTLIGLFSVVHGTPKTGEEERDLMGEVFLLDKLFYVANNVAIPRRQRPPLSYGDIDWA